MFKEEFKLTGLGAYDPGDVVEAAKGVRGSAEFSIPVTVRGGIAVLSTRFYDVGGYEMLPSLSVP